MFSQSFTITGLCLTLLVTALFCAPSASAAKFRTIEAFCAQAACADGQLPSGDLVQDTAGNLYGITYAGGDHNAGTVFELSPSAKKSGWAFHRLYSFCVGAHFPCPDGESPFGRLVIDGSGNLYGATGAGGGADDAGTVFELMPNAVKTKWRLKLLHLFCRGSAGCQDGYDPSSGLAYAGQAAGKPYDGRAPLYGTTETGGRHGGGIAFQLTPRSGRSLWREDVIYDFCAEADCADGTRPWQELAVDANSNLFGVTFGLGEGPEFGRVFQLTKSGKNWKETVLHVFCQAQPCTEGQGPNAVTLDAHGNLFGTTYRGGATDAGVVFRIVPNGVNSPYDVVYTFCAQVDCTDGFQSGAALAIDKHGNLYGTTYYGGGHMIDPDDRGGGTLFRLKPDGTYVSLHRFCSKSFCNDGNYPDSGLFIDAQGDVIGTTVQGGKNQQPYEGGTVFQLRP
jgi:uncharacterized repeat protein (TIGR03803 family)